MSLQTLNYTLFFVLLLSLSSLAVAQQPDIKFGSVAMDVPVVMHKRLAPLINYLSLYLKRPVSLKLSKNMPGAIKDVANGKVELAYLTPVAYIRAHETGDSQIIVKTRTNNKASFQLMIVVREDSPIKTVEELAGRSFAFGDEAALLQRAVVVGSGISLEKMGSYEFLGHYDNIVRAVLYGEFDAGILKDTSAYKWQGKGIRILYSSPELPPFNITASRKVDVELLSKLKQAFLRLDINNAEHRSVIKALDKKYDGFADAKDSDYDVVRKLIKPFK